MSGSTKGDILEGHFQATHDRFAAGEDTVLVLHDTTEFSFQRESPDRTGITYSVNSGRDKKGRIREHTVCGILMHSSLAVTTDGLPLGLTAVKFWNRKKFKDSSVSPSDAFTSATGRATFTSYFARESSGASRSITAP